MPIISNPLSYGESCTYTAYMCGLIEIIDITGNYSTIIKLSTDEESGYSFVSVSDSMKSHWGISVDIKTITVTRISSGSVNRKIYIKEL